MPRLITHTAGLFTALLMLLLVSAPVVAQQSGIDRVGDYEIHYDVLPTAFLNPQVAQGYNLVRSRGQGMVRVTVLKRLDDGSVEPVRATVSGQVGNLAGQVNGLGFRMVEVGRREGYSHIATFRFSHDDPLRFNLRVIYAPGEPAHELHFIRRLYLD